MHVVNISTSPPEGSDTLFLELYRIHVLSGGLLSTLGDVSGRSKHVTTAAIVNLLDTWLRAIAIAEGPSVSSWSLYEVQAVRLAIHNASATMLKKLNDALWTRAAHVIIEPPKRLRRKSTWKHRQADTRNMIVDFLLNNPGLNIDEISRRLQIPSNSANGHLLALEADGRVRIERQGRRYRKFFADAPQRAASECVPGAELETSTLPSPESLSA